MESLDSIEGGERSINMEVTMECCDQVARVHIWANYKYAIANLHIVVANEMRFKAGVCNFHRALGKLYDDAAKCCESPSECPHHWPKVIEKTRERSYEAGYCLVLKTPTKEWKERCEARLQEQADQGLRETKTDNLTPASLAIQNQKQWTEWIETENEDNLSALTLWERPRFPPPTLSLPVEAPIEAPASSYSASASSAATYPSATRGESKRKSESQVQVQSAEQASKYEFSLEVRVKRPWLTGFIFIATYVLFRIVKSKV